MADARKDPRRRCRKLRDWPEPDQHAWRAAVAKAAEESVRHEDGAAAAWRETTRKTVQDAYGRWLTFLDLNGWLDAEAHPAERLTPDRLRAFMADLQATVAPVTLRNRITNLSEALRVMAPGADFPYLRRARARLKARARPIRNKRRQIAHSRDLLGLGLELTQKAESGDVARANWSAVMYRDGVMIMMLACRPIRRRTFAGMRLGQHLVKREDAYAILLDESETKNHHRFEQLLDPALTPHIDRYLEEYRPQLLGGTEDDHLWISVRGTPLSEFMVYMAIVGRTEAAFGFGISPHRFRDSAVTSLGATDPELVWLAPALLHHADRRIAEQHYDHAKTGHAVGLWQDFVRAERRAVRGGNDQIGRGGERG